MDSLDRFHSANKSRATWQTYDWGLGQFLKHLRMDADSFATKARAEPEWAEGAIQSYMKLYKDRFERKEVSSGLARMRLSPVKLFCVMNKLRLDWEYVNRQLPKSRHYGDDRVPTVEEVRGACDASDVRSRAIIMCMASGGFRLGAWEYLRWKHVMPIEKRGKAIAARVMVYAGEDEQHFTFLTPEAFRALKAYMDYRQRSGEAVSGESVLVRDAFNSRSGHNGAAVAPFPVKPGGIQYLLEQAWSRAGVRKSLGRRKREFKVAHSLRKFFRTRAEQAMRPVNIELLMGHGIGISSSYYKPTEGELLEDYLRAVPALTLGEAESIRRESEDRADGLEAKMREQEEKVKRLSEIMEKMEAEDDQRLKEIEAELKRRHPEG